MHVALTLAFFDTAASCSVMDTSDIIRSLLVIGLAFGLIWFAFRSMVWKVEPSPANLGNFIAFNAVVMGVLGGAVVVMASKQWPVALLAAGACLGVGFLVGLLFGYPMSDSGGDPSKSKNLLQQSVDAISKLVAGATLVKAQSVYEEFQKVAVAISQYATAGSCGGNGSYVFGAGVTVYFLLLGFLAALLLSNTYHLVTPVPDSPTAQAVAAKKVLNPTLPGDAGIDSGDDSKPNPPVEGVVAGDSLEESCTSQATTH